MSVFAAAHPGKMGDALYTLPTIREIYRQTGNKCDFYTSKYCEPLRDLFLYQDCINDFIVPDSYVAERFDMGAQPWFVPIPDKYDLVYQLGFRSVPDRPLHQFIGLYAGIDKPLIVEYNYPSMEYPIEGTYICIAPRGKTTFSPLFIEFAKKSPWPCLIIGGRGEKEDGLLGYDFTGASILETVQILSGASAFVGLMSSQLVLANGFSYPKIAPHDGRSWDMRHVIKQESNHYPVNPTADSLISFLRERI